MARRKNKQKKATEGSLSALTEARKVYKEEGHADNCGDKVAGAMEVFKTDEGLDVEGLKACLRDNDCKIPAVDMNKNGAAGRFRMVAGLMLRAAAKQRQITIGNQKFGETVKKVKGKKSATEKAIR